MTNPVKPTVLVVDDDSAVRMAIAGILDSKFYEFSFASGGVEALEAAFAGRFDTILLDVLMPDLDGFEVCRRLREDPRTAHVPVILVSGLSDRDSRLEGLAAGADDFLNKPMDRMELRAKVRTSTRLNRYRMSSRDAGLELMVEHSETGFVRLDGSGKVVGSNPAALRLLGIPAGAEVHGEVFVDLLRREWVPAGVGEGGEMVGQWTRVMQRSGLACVQVLEVDAVGGGEVAGVLVTPDRTLRLRVAERGVEGEGTGPVYSVVGHRYAFLLTGVSTGGAYSVMEAYVPAGSGVPLHVHAREDEGFLVLEGEFEFSVGSQVTRLGPGGSVLASREVPHLFLNVGSTAGRMLVTMTPSGMERFFSEIGVPLVSRNAEPVVPSEADLRRLAEVAPAHGIRLL